MSRSEVKCRLIQKQIDITRAISLVNDLHLRRYYLITLDLDHNRKYLKMFGHTKVLIRPLEFRLYNIKCKILASEKDLSKNSYTEQPYIETGIKYGAIIDYQVWDSSTAPLLLSYEYLSDLFKEYLANNYWS